MGEKMQKISRVLIVDDSLLGRQSVKNILNEMNFTLIEANDGFEALKIIEEDKPDLVFLDLLMPKIDGFGVLKALKEKKIEIPVVVISADIQDSTQKQCKELGAGGFLNKPFSKKDLDLILEKISGKA